MFARTSETVCVFIPKNKTKEIFYIVFLNATSTLSLACDKIHVEMCKHTDDY